MVKLSACVIAKNEETNIVRWINNLKPIVDEMVVVDTGSTDKTIEIAKNAGAKVFRIAWRHNFAAAKNYALTKATGNWIAFLDADEFFSEPSRAVLRQTLDEIDGNKSIIAVQSELCNIDADNDNRVMSTTIQTRVFRRMPKLHYVGRVHEQLKLPPSKRKWLILDSNLQILHTGYSESLTEIKNRRNLEMLLADVKASGGEKPEHYTYLSTSYLNLKEYENAIHYANLAIETKTGGLAQAYAKQYRIILKAQRALGKSMAELQKTVDRALLDLPDYPDFLWEDALLAMQARDFLRLERDITKISDQVADPNFYKKYETTITADVYRIKTAWGLLLNFQGRRAEAAALLLERMRVEPKDPGLLSSYLGVTRDFDPEKILGELKAVYTTEDDRIYVAHELGNHVRNAVYLYFVRPPQGTYEYFMARGEFENATKEAAFALADCYFKGLKFYRGGVDTDNWETLLPEGFKADSVADRDSKLASGELIKRSLQIMCRLALAVLSIEGDGIWRALEHLRLLPEGMQNVIFRYHGDADKLTAADFDAYRTLIREVCTFGAKNVVDRYASLAADFDEKDMMTAAGDLFVFERFHALLPLYVSLSDESPYIDAQFWYRLGRCLLSEGDPMGASDCFQKAVDGGATEIDAKGFNDWCKVLAQRAAGGSK